MVEAATGITSGVFFRPEDLSNIYDQTRNEANIFDISLDQTYRTGAITTPTAPEVIAMIEDGNWHEYEVIAMDDFMILKIRGQQRFSFKRFLRPQRD